MRTPSLLSALALLLCVAPACSPDKPPETPESTASSATPDAPKDMPGHDDSAAGGSDKAAETPAPQQGQGAPAKPVDKSLSLETYEMTPADCNDLGKHFGEVTRADLLAPLNEKQRAATAAQIDKVSAKQEETWTNMCHNVLVDKAVDHDAINCAFVAKTVKAFDVCFNGSSTIGDQPTKPQPGKRKK